MVTIRKAIFDVIDSHNEPWGFYESFAAGSFTEANIAALFAGNSMTAANVASLFATGSFDTLNLLKVLPADSITNAVLLQAVLDGAFVADDATRALFGASFLSQV